MPFPTTPPAPSCPTPRCRCRQAATGPLAGLNFAVKDLFDVAGYPTSGGQHFVLALSGIKARTAPTVQTLLDAGARFVGKTITDELAFSMNGQNAHFGSPINGAAPDRRPERRGRRRAGRGAGRALDAQGNVVNWTHELWSHPHCTRPGSGDGSYLLASQYLEKPLMQPFPADVPQPAGGADRNAIPLYEFPSQKVCKRYLEGALLRTSVLRTLGAYANVFALESFMDELAAAAGADPVEFGLRHMKDPRARAVIEAAAQRAGWQPNARADGRNGRGVAFSKYKNLTCYVALVADVTVDPKTGAVRVTRVVAAVDAGQIVNPDGVVNQFEGGVIQSTNWTLKESVRFERKGVTTRSWADYPILRFEEVPSGRAPQPAKRTLSGRRRRLARSDGRRARERGGHAVANATGKRIRALPLSPPRVRRALA